jgi:glycosyltransferase involved in cell wall biosynthesis
VFASGPSHRARRITRTVAEVTRLAHSLDADVYQFHDPELIPSGLLLARLGKRVIYDAHESVPDDILLKTWIRPRLRAPVSGLAAAVERAAARRFAAVVAATPTIGARFAEYGARTIVVSNFPRIEELPAAGRAGAAKERAVCYVGSISEIRGADVMVQAMEEVDGVLLLAGSFSSPELRARLAASPGWKRVIELGYIGLAELGRTLARSRAGLALLAPTPTYIVSQPTKVYEYMAAGVPAIVSDFPLWRGIVEENGCGLCVDPTNPLEVRRAIGWILDHPAEADAMGRNGRRAVERHYRWEPEADRLLALYEGLLRGTGSHTRRKRSRESISKT